MSEAWYKENCPECEAVNWICNGDESDLTGVDVEAYKCRTCGNIEMLGGDDQLKMMQEIDPSISKKDCYWELGLETPN